MKFRIKDLQNYLRGKIDWKKVAQDLTLKSFETNFSNDVLETDILPNRYADASSLIGLAKEISKVSGIHGSYGFQTDNTDNIYQHKSALDPYKSVKKNPYKSVSDPHKSVNLVKVQTPHCFYYFGKVILNVENKPSPKWLKEFVEFYGFNSINFLVDLANFVMIEYGAPLHIFDLDKISLPIYIRLAKKGEKFISLEDKEYKLLGGEIVIADKKKILGLAGIKGGKNSAVDLQTKNIFIEAAVFDPVKIYSTSRKLNLKTDASFRFERKVAPIRSLQALLRLSFLIQENLGGEVLKGVIGEKKLKEKVINFNIERLNKFLGINFRKEEIRKILKSLEIKIVSENKNTMRLIPPLDRLDLETEEDIIEEIIRIYDLNKIPAIYETPPKEVSIAPEIEFNNYLRKILTKAGYDEVHNYSFFGDKDLNNLNRVNPRINQRESAVEILNPISENYKYFQTRLIPNLLKSVRLNQFYFKEIRIFEISKVAYYIHGLNGSNTDKTDKKYPYESALDPYRSVNEEYHLGIGFAFKDPEEILKELKGVLKVLEEELKINFNLKEIDQNQVEIFIHGLNRSNTDYTDNRNQYKSALDPRKSMNKNPYESVLDPRQSALEKIGIFSLIPKKVLEDYDLDLEVGAIELNLEKLRKYQKLIKKFEPWPVFPSIVRDLSFFVDEKIKFSEIEKEIKKQKINFLTEIKLIDVYFTDKKSMTLRFIFNHPQRSLKDEEVNLEMRKIEEFLKEKYRIILR
jgi:phenylalanyl-tRNA synthetase beta chain